MTIAAFLLDALALATLAWRWPVVRGTTLVGSWGWLLASLAAVPCGLGGTASWRLMTATITLCPAVSLLGAKRPQDQAWHFIVATLWVVLALPGLQQLGLDRAGELNLHPVRAWFLALLLLAGTLNSLFSRFWPSVLLAGMGQTILLAPFLPWPLNALPVYSAEAGWLCYMSAVILAASTGWRGRHRGPSLDRLWCDFRAAFGLVWTLRVAERLNDTARNSGWNVIAGWSGFRSPANSSTGDGMSAEQQRAFRQSLYSLLRRFVSEDWIHRRWDGELHHDTVRRHE